MEIYKDLDGDSSVMGYDIIPDGIVVTFTRGKYRNYKYTTGSAGVSAINEMQKLARQGDGLGAFIGNEKPGFADKW